MEHEDTPECWCEPELWYENEESGVRIWVHREVH